MLRVPSKVHLWYDYGSKNDEKQHIPAIAGCENKLGTAVMQSGALFDLASRRERGNTFW